MGIAEMHRDAPSHLHVIKLPEFLGCQFQLKVTILHIGLQPCPTFIRVNKCALVRPNIIQQDRETKRKSRLQALAKTKNAPGETSKKVTSLPQRPPPGLSQLPLLPQEQRQVVHGLKRLWVIRTEVRFAPCKSSAVQGLRLASWDDGVGGVGPQAWIHL